MLIKQAEIIRRYRERPDRPMPTATHITSITATGSIPLQGMEDAYRIDIGSYGWAIVASGNGTVIYTGKNGGYGNTVSLIAAAA